MKKRYILLILVIVACLILVRLGAETGLGSTYSTKPAGTKALSLLLERQGFETSRWLYPFDRLEAQDKGSVMFIVEPAQIGGQKALLEWVERGNSIVVFSSDFSMLNNLFPELKISSAKEAFSEEITNVLTQERHSVVDFSCPADQPDCSGVKSISKTDISFAIQSNEAQILAGKKDRAVAIKLKKGDGAIWIFSGSEPIQNQNIDRADNLKLLYQLATAQKRVFFDEFHHGYVAPVSQDQRARLELLRVLIWYLVAILLLLALSRMVRFGPATPQVALGSSASIEFASVLGLLYQEHSASRILEQYIKAWQVRIETAYGISRRLNEKQTVEELVLRGYIKSDYAQRLLDALSGLRQNQKLDGEKIRSIVSVLEEIFHLSRSKGVKSHG